MKIGIVSQNYVDDQVKPTLHRSQISTEELSDNKLDFDILIEMYQEFKKSPVFQADIKPLFAIEP